MGVRPGGVVEQNRDAFDALAELTPDHPMWRAQLVLVLASLARAVDHIAEELGL